MITGKLGGHIQLQTTMKHYTATNAIMIQEVNERMNNYHLDNRESLISETVN
jgi:hypothetical protein